MAGSYPAGLIPKVAAMLWRSKKSRLVVLLPLLEISSYWVEFHNQISFSNYFIPI